MLKIVVGPSSTAYSHPVARTSPQSRSLFFTISVKKMGVTITSKQKRTLDSTSLLTMPQGLYTSVFDESLKSSWASDEIFSMAFKDKWRNLSVANGLGSREKSKTPKMKTSPAEVPATPLPLALTPASVTPLSQDASTDVIVSDPSRPVPEGNNAAKCNAVIYEALATLKEPNGSDSAAIASYIEVGCIEVTRVVKHGRRLHALKFVESVLPLYTPDPNGGLEPPSVFEAEASRSLGLLLDQMRSPSLKSHSYLMTSVLTKRLSAVARKRPFFYGRILPGLLGLNPLSLTNKAMHLIGVNHALKNASEPCMDCTNPDATQEDGRRSKESTHVDSGGSGSGSGSGPGLGSGSGSGDDNRDFNNSVKLIVITCFLKGIVTIITDAIGAYNSMWVSICKYDALKKRRKSDALKKRRKSDALKKRDESDDLEARRRSDALKKIDESDDLEARRRSDALKKKDESDDLEARRRSDALKKRDESDDLKARRRSDFLKPRRRRGRR